MDGGCKTEDRDRVFFLFVVMCLRLVLLSWGISESVKGKRNPLSC